MSASLIRPGEAGREIKSVPSPGYSTLRETVLGIEDNVFEAARREQIARDHFQALPPGNAKEAQFKGWAMQAKYEQAHWREYLAVFREWMALHPELADRPLNTRCGHGPTCLIGHPAVRDVGADDDTPGHWTEGSVDASP